ncbi:MAG: hypothetical protein WC655_08655 [Candidatus Hydrogenedentales bacterium]|jgi:hypothetical protein
MYWSILCEDASGAPESAAHADGRFVLHKHNDVEGPHLDLRLEQDGYLLGWRIDGVSLEGAPWAAEKAPHAVEWLDRDGDAQRQDAGTFCWLERNADERAVLLRGAAGDRVVRARREKGLTPGTIRAVRAALAEANASEANAAQLIADGAAARHRVVERFCGLGRELDGDAFDVDTWRKTLAALSLEDIHTHLRAYEVRFDKKYPPAPVSTPERLPDEEPSRRSGDALAILRG